jgi:hypothetical protein
MPNCKLVAIDINRHCPSMDKWNVMLDLQSFEGYLHGKTTWTTYLQQVAPRCMELHIFPIIYDSIYKYNVSTTTDATCLMQFKV